MFLPRFVAIAVLLPAAALAGVPADPTRADVTVPAPVYQSVFANYQSMQEEEQSPDKVWKRANEEVGRIGGHAGYLRDEKESGEKAGHPAATPHHQH